MRNRRIGLAIAAAFLLLLGALRHPSAKIEILTHDVADQAPSQVQAALDLGVLAVKVLVTWTDRQANY